MSDQPFLKCACQNCGGPIEFPVAGVGLKVECPHCGRKTVLSGPVAPAMPVPPPAIPHPVAPVAGVPPKPVPQPAAMAPPASGKSPLLLVLVLLAAVAVLTGGGFWYFKMGPGGRNGGSTGTVNSSPPAPGGATNEPSSRPPAVPTPPATAKSLEDLKPGPVTLEKAKSGSLYYAVGIVKNDSDHQRFGVKVEIEFTDAKGRAAGKTTDYTQVIEPRKEWRFRALVLDAKAASGQVVGIKEDN